MALAVAQKDEELVSLRGIIAEAESTLQRHVREAIARRDEELRAMIIKKEAEVAARMARREQEIMEAVRRREEDVTRMWAEWERQTREAMARAVDERMEWVQQQANELELERERLENVKGELEAKMKALEAPAGERRTRSKNPLEEVKNIMAPLSRLADSPEPIKTASRPPAKLPVFQTPLPTKSVNLMDDLAPPSAMKGVILTTTGETVATPTPAELAKLFVDTPKVGLNFAKIFDFDGDDESGDSDGDLSEDGYETDTRPRTSLRREKDRQSSDGEATPTQATSSSRATVESAPAVRPTRLRRPSIRASSASATCRSATLAAASAASSASGSSRPRATRAASASAVSASSSVVPPSSATTTLAALAQAPQPHYDLNDVENLPSPFIKKVEERAAPTIKPAVKAPRKSGSTLRAMAVVNAAKANARPSSATSTSSASNNGTLTAVRSSIAKAQKANEEARKALAARAS